MSEPSRKLFADDSLCRDPAGWATIKRLKRNHFANATVKMTLSHAGDEIGDTLAVLRNIYSRFRPERPQYHLNEDVVMCLAPGIHGDKPVGETLNTS
eukprot:1122446-Lingulodinium_polyedra.AAC.1